MQYGCLGEHLPHSFSKEIHEMIGEYPYGLFEVAESELDVFLRNRDFKAINVTIPYKQSVIPYLSDISEKARSIGAVNTVVNRDGKLFGYNTDHFGLMSLIKKSGIDISGKKVLILGTGGTSKTAYAVVSDLKASKIIRLSRRENVGDCTYERAYAEHCDADIIINTTPCGMFPDTDCSPIDINKFNNLSGVIDVIYNPLTTRLIIDALAKGIPAENGLYMLVAQAIKAAEIFTGKVFENDITDKIYKKIFASKQNIVLIGMPSSGKTTVGKALAKALGREFIDTDKEIEKIYLRSPAEIIEQDGIEAFRKTESLVTENIGKKSGTVIATGGGTVLNRENVKSLKQNGRLFWLDRSLEKLCCTNDRPLSNSKEKLEKLYAERREIYNSAADVRIDANADINSCVLEIIKECEL